MAKIKALLAAAAVVLAAFTGFAAFGVSSAHAEVPPLACAIQGTGSVARTKMLCGALGQQLGRSVNVVDDARSVARGDALHIIQGDVSWLVIWLRDGRTRAFTRVSSVDAAGHELEFLARASRFLSRESEVDGDRCVRVEPNGGRRMRSADLAYPWVDLKRCRVRAVDVVDPWWSADGKRSPSFGRGGSADELGG